MGEGPAVRIGAREAMVEVLCKCSSAVAATGWWRVHEQGLPPRRGLVVCPTDFCNCLWEPEKREAGKLRAGGPYQF
jgi:hypothetical protein